MDVTLQVAPLRNHQVHQDFHILQIMRPRIRAALIFAILAPTCKVPLDPRRRITTSLAMFLNKAVDPLVFLDRMSKVQVHFVPTDRNNLFLILIKIVLVKLRFLVSNNNFGNRRGSWMRFNSSSPRKQQN
mmetsp:Transcript_17263/g.47477  ORF Transcript_17263/g.47477 Transcript_17263/m.47477 type:complete len:130 (+) Transcript_17263:929-1318(+)